MTDHILSGEVLSPQTLSLSGPAQADLTRLKGEGCSEAEIYREMARLHGQQMAEIFRMLSAVVLTSAAKDQALTNRDIEGLRLEAEKERTKAENKKLWRQVVILMTVLVIVVGSLVRVVGFSDRSARAADSKPSVANSVPLSGYMSLGSFDVAQLRWTDCHAKATVRGICPHQPNDIRPSDLFEVTASSGVHLRSSIPDQVGVSTPPGEMKLPSGTVVRSIGSVVQFGLIEGRPSERQVWIQVEVVRRL